MNILLRKFFLLLYTVTICIAVQYECASKNTSCGCGHFNVQLNSTENLNGEEAVPYSWSMIVLFDFYWLERNSTDCSGSILNKHFILTSARCVRGFRPFYITIKAGIHYALDQNGTTRVVEHVHFHPNYTGHTQGYTNDIALLELREPLNFTK